MAVYDAEGGYYGEDGIYYDKDGGFWDEEGYYYDKYGGRITFFCVAKVDIFLFENRVKKSTF